MVLGIVSLVIAAAAVVVALWAAVRTNALQGRLATLEEDRRQDEIETRDAAILRGFATRYQSHPHVHVQIAPPLFNDGAHDATDVTVRLTTRQGGETYIDHAEIETIAAGQAYRVTFEKVVMYTLPFALELEWSDGRRKRQRRKMEVNTVEAG